MAERLALLLAAAVLVALATAAVRRWARARTRRLMREPATALWGAIGAQPDGRPTVVAFSTPSCAACRTAQHPVLDQLQRQLGAQSVRVVRVDASVQPEVAGTFGVLTVPSTVVFSTHGSVAAVNHGFAPAERLLEQIAAA